MAKWYVCKTDWEGASYGGITLQWNYKGKLWEELSIPGYIKKTPRPIQVPASYMTAGLTTSNPTIVVHANSPGPIFPSQKKAR